jgi:CelD/BcsL family acetyltransferase involved in cellulose biosynthesis
MRMRQSLAEIEDAFAQEIELDRERRERLSRTANKRTRKRQVRRVHKQGSVRFILLSLALIATAVIVTVVMFETLYYVMG